MPHVTIEYTSNVRSTLEPRDLFTRIHDVLVDVGGIRRGNCKSRIVERDQFLVGDGGKAAAFVHADVRFLEGRRDGVKQQIGRELLAVLRGSFFGPPEVDDLQLTVELHDIPRSAYFKFPEGTLG